MPTSSFHIMPCLIDFAVKAVESLTTVNCLVSWLLTNSHNWELELFLNLLNLLYLLHADSLITLSIRQAQLLDGKHSDCRDDNQEDDYLSHCL